MRRLFRQVGLILLFGATSAFGGDVRESGGERDKERAQRLRTGYDFREFLEFAPATRRIDFDDIDHGLLAAAVFHETNRVRAEQRLPALAFRPELENAARLQAEAMARMETVSHRHPDAELRELSDRLEHVGLQPAFAAENVAMSFGIEYEAGEQVFPRRENGERVFSSQPDGEPIPPHTYISYAEQLLQQWMNSPGHRENILREDPEELGSGHRHAVNEMGMDIFYSVQVFFTALDVPPGATVVRPGGDDR